MTGAKIDGQQFIALNTDFGYDALGGFGKVGSQLGTHSIEVLEAPKARQSDRIAGPPQTVGRWFSKLLDALTLRSFRQQGKFQRGLEQRNCHRFHKNQFAQRNLSLKHHVGANQKQCAMA